MAHRETRDYLPLVRSPLAHGQVDEHSRTSSNIDLEAPQKQAEHNVHEFSHEPRPDVPHFERAHSATSIELFYDLFFVANLTVFTQVKEVNDKDTLAEYVGFFSVLWFVWYQVGLYDVRFAVDSVFERICKALQFGVMIGFAIIGPDFTVGKDNIKYSAFRALSMILMVNRLVLVVQYLQSAWFLRHYRKTVLPMLIISGTYFVAAMIYLGVFFTFHSGSDHSYVTWYVVAILETIATTAVASFWTIISFKGTHLIERMSLLTLIILGEGVMGLAKRCQAIVKSQIFDFTASTIGGIISSVLMLYFLYQLYFDWVTEEHFGSIKQQIWSFLHFPLHVFLVLAVEAANQALTWRAACEKANALLNDAYYYQNQFYYHNFTASGFEEQAQAINGTAQTMLDSFLYTVKSLNEISVWSDANDAITLGVSEIADGAGKPVDTLTTAVAVVYNTLMNVAFAAAGFEPPEDKGAYTNSTGAPTLDSLFDSSQEESTKVAEVFILTFIYFFVAIGLVVLICGILAWMSNKEKTMVHRVRLGVSTVIGLTLCLLALIPLSVTSSWLYVNYSWSPWLLPTVMLCLGIAVLVNSAKFSVPSFGRLRRRN